MILTVTLNAAIDKRYVVKEFQVGEVNRVAAVSYTHLTLPTIRLKCIYRWSPYH